MSHTKRQYNINNYGFAEMVRSLFDVDNLESLHELDLSLTNAILLDQASEAETFFHQKFYERLNQDWTEIKRAFESFVKNEVSPLFNQDFLFQKFPSFRVQVPNQTAVSKWHYDSDLDHGHPDWEINFQIALTEMKETSATWVETVPGLNDFNPMNLNVGEFAIFNGNKCRHGNKPNRTEQTRVSLDFRVLPIDRYDENTEKTSYYGNKFVDGGYYKRFRRGSSVV